MSPSRPPPFTAAYFIELFNRPRPFEVGLEEEIMVLDRETFDLLPEAPDLLATLGLDARFKTELPASQLEIATRPAPTIPALAEQLFEARRLLAEAIGDRARLAAAGVHPFAAAQGLITDSERYQHTLSRYGSVARRQLIGGLHVHLGISDADRVLGLYNALRAYLPEIAALAANGPIFGGADTGMASMRPQISSMLPRQGVPPALPSWEWLADQLDWGLKAGSLSRPGEWWWELRPNVVVGTLEVRVPDAQTTVADAIAVCSFITGLALWLAQRLDAGENDDRCPAWRINENRWSAARFGVEGRLADLRTGKTVRTRDRLTELIEQISAAIPPRMGIELDSARSLIERSPAQRQREVMEGRDPLGLTEWLAGRFLEPPANLGAPAGDTSEGAG